MPAVDVPECRSSEGATRGPTYYRNVIRQSIDPDALAPAYAAAHPFPHAVIDDFLEPDIAVRLADYLASVDVSEWPRDDHPDQVNKRWMPDPDRLEPVAADALRYFNSPAALEFFERLTGIGPLIADDGYLGGGVHISGPGGRLGVHCDFNIHPDLGIHRRLNALLFLNRDWDPAWNGQLELYDESLTEPVSLIDPGFNRLVIFSVTDRAFHGVPKRINCPDDRRRCSLALYYYTAERPEDEKGPFHWASWQRTGPNRDEE